MPHRSSFFVIVLSALGLFVPALRGQDGLRGALSRTGDSAYRPSTFGLEVAAADFDNDQKPDGAVLLRAGQVDGQKAFRVELHLTAGRNASINFYTAETNLSVSALDVNRDGAPDIVVEKAFTHERVKVYLNNGDGEFRATSERFAAADDSAPHCRTTVAVQNPPVAFLPPTRGFELAANKATTVVRGQDASDASFWPQGLLVQCGARAPSAARAPPSLLSL